MPEDHPATSTQPANLLLYAATALGDTAEAHAELSPHDVPKGSPIR